jgi:stalled ribosome rescue protein Dom34
VTVDEINREQIRLIDEELDRLKQMANVVDLGAFVKFENNRRRSRWEAHKKRLQPITKERSRRVNG